MVRNKQIKIFANQSNNYDALTLAKLKPYDGRKYKIETMGKMDGIYLSSAVAEE